MKINVEFDLTPEEFRQALGLPDVAVFQQQLLEQIQKQMESGVEGYDPMSLMQPFLQQSGMGQGLTQGISQGLSQGLSSFGTYQQMMLDMLRQAGQSAAQARSAEEPAPDAADSGSAKRAGSSAAKKGTASVRSRAKSKSE
ncbi:DUF6489 family protein [Halomonas sp. BM-2019]|uniref:DUF6489 family protein n=1 Tax=Halomonas sp. BM-2019 TaxID=2811227 RepID=UPI001B3C1DBE|nr:MAG: hypothetical protein J5F18_14795 [Halomonas sp. BM-2019]